MAKTLWESKQFDGFRVQVDGEPYDKPKPSISMVVSAGEMDVCLRMNAEEASSLANRILGEVEWGKQLKRLKGKERDAFIEARYRVKAVKRG